MKPQLWLDGQHSALSTPNHSELSDVQHAVNSAHNVETSTEKGMLLKYIIS